MKMLSELITDLLKVYFAEGNIPVYCYEEYQYHEPEVDVYTYRVNNPGYQEKNTDDFAVEDGKKYVEL
jgi:hypothetical protein